MKRTTLALYSTALSTLVLALACAKTPFGGIPTPQLTDEELVLELEAAAAGQILLPKA